MRCVPSISARLARACEDGTTPGAACVVIRDGALAHRSAHGTTCVNPAGAGAAVTCETWFDVASLTKIMATTAVAVALHSQRRLDLDAPLCRFLLEFANCSCRRVPLRGVLEQAPDVTVRDLLAHRSGLPACGDFWVTASTDWLASRIFTEPRLRPEGADRVSAFRRSRHLCKEAVMGQELESKPRTAAVYSDPGFILLGMALERAGGASLDSLFDRLVAAPLGLSSTFFVNEAQPSPRRPRPCAATRASSLRDGAVNIAEVDDDNAFGLAGVAGHAGLFSTVDDVARFGEAVRRLHAGERMGSLRSWSVQHFLQRDEATPGSTRALGFDTPSPGFSAAGTLMDRDSTFGHLGFTGCSLWFDLSRRLTVALLTNRVNGGGDPAGVRTLRAELHDLAVESTGG